jgi:hypothetical protein
MNKMSNIVYYTNWCGYCNEIQNISKAHQIIVEFKRIKSIDYILNNDSIKKRENFIDNISPLFVSENRVIGSMYCFMNHFHIRYKVK